jgi:hypothetical protein
MTAKKNYHKPPRRRPGKASPGGTTATYIRNFKFHGDQVKTIDAAIEKAKATSGRSVDSAALELICLDYGRADVARAAGRVGSRSPGQDVR